MVSKNTYHMISLVLRITMHGKEIPNLLAMAHVVISRLFEDLFRVYSASGIVR